MIRGDALAGLLALVAAESDALIGSRSTDQWAWGRFAVSAVARMGLDSLLENLYTHSRKKKEENEEREEEWWVPE